MMELLIEQEKDKLAAVTMIGAFASVLEGEQLFSEMSLEIILEQKAESMEQMAILRHRHKILQKAKEALALRLTDKERRQSIKRLVFRLLAAEFHISLPWGILVGVRPTKLAASLQAKAMSKEEIRFHLENEYLLSAEKITLLLDLLDVEQSFTKASPHSMAIYLNIPFCPSRCLYCSFAAEVLTKSRQPLDVYLKALLTEIQLSAKAYKDYKVESIYFGGGTPSMLKPEEIAMIFQCLQENYDLRAIKEINFEAGRPKTITRQLLEQLKAIGVNRLSINPQTTNPQTLALIGRFHNHEDIVRAFQLAREYEFNTINADLIAGLYGEELKDFQQSLGDVLALKPENITVHCLSTKTASLYAANQQLYSLPSLETVNRQVSFAQESLSRASYFPYYLYRQKKIAGGLENVGYSLSGHSCIYNVRIIQEKQTILAFGAGASNKFYHHQKDKLEHFINSKDLTTYMKRVEEMADVKLKNACKF